jgi:predicted DNA-binding transcriptional regulator YafY
MKRVQRQELILRSLRRSGFLTVSELGQEVGASRRTILRDIGGLRDQGYLIHSECGRGGGLRLDPASVQASAPLSVTEVFALILGVAAMRAAGQLPFSSLADAGLAKIERALPAQKVRDLRRLLDCLHVGQLSPQQDLSDLGAMDEALLPCVEAAFLDQQQLRFTYRDARRAETERAVEPQALLVLPPLWYLVAWDPARDGFRHFRMDRISRPEVLDGPPFRRRHVPFGDDVCPYSQRPG